MSIPRALFGLAVMMLVLLHETRPVRAITRDAEAAFTAFDGMVVQFATSVARGQAYDTDGGVQAAEALLQKVQDATRYGLTRLEADWNEQMRIYTQSRDI